MARLSLILTEANDLLDGFSQPMILQTFLVGTVHTSTQPSKALIITMTDCHRPARGDGAG